MFSLAFFFCVYFWVILESACKKISADRVIIGTINFEDGFSPQNLHIFLIEMLKGWEYKPLAETRGHLH